MMIILRAGAEQPALPTPAIPIAMGVFSQKRITTIGKDSS